MSSAAQPVEILRQGILACRAEHWRSGLDLLTRAAQQLENKGNLPGLFYSFLGVAMARCEGRRKEGLELCRYAVDREPTEPDNYVNLARMYLLVGQRRAAWKVVQQGLALKPDHDRLRTLAAELGVRRAPVLPFLSRGNPVNVIAGLVRQAVLRLVSGVSARQEERRRERLDDELGEDELLEVRPN